MQAGHVEHWLDQVKRTSELYDKLYNVLHNYEGINNLNVSIPPLEPGLPPTRRLYKCLAELVNWSTQLRERKIELNEIRTQQNDVRRLETKEKGDLLKQDNVMTKLL